MYIYIYIYIYIYTIYYSQTYVNRNIVEDILYVLHLKFLNFEFEKLRKTTFMMEITS